MSVLFLQPAPLVSLFFCSSFCLVFHVPFHYSYLMLKETHDKMLRSKYNKKYERFKDCNKALQASLIAQLVGKESACNAGDTGSILGQEDPLKKR